MSNVRYFDIVAANGGNIYVPSLQRYTPIKHIAASTAVIAALVSDTRFIITEVSEDGTDRKRITMTNAGVSQVTNKEVLPAVPRPKVAKIPMVFKVVKPEEVVPASRKKKRTKLGIDFG